MIKSQKNVDSLLSVYGWSRLCRTYFTAASFFLLFWLTNYKVGSMNLIMLKGSEFCARFLNRWIYESSYIFNSKLFYVPFSVLW